MVRRYMNGVQDVLSISCKINIGIGNTQLQITNVESM